jgi:hypothetical protein
LIIFSKWLIIKNKLGAGGQPVILATWEAEEDQSLRPTLANSS